MMGREEIESKYSIRKLQNGEDINLFDCGDEDLNDFILNEAKLYRKELLAVSYVLERVDTHLVHAYFSMANDRISLADFENKTGCRFLTVDAYAAAIPFYEKNGFVPLNDDDKDAPTRLLYFDLRDIADGLDQD